MFGIDRDRDVDRDRTEEAPLGLADTAEHSGGGVCVRREVQRNGADLHAQEAYQQSHVDSLSGQYQQPVRGAHRPVGRLQERPHPDLSGQAKDPDRGRLHLAGRVTGFGPLGLQSCAARLPDRSLPVRGGPGLYRSVEPALFRHRPQRAAWTRDGHQPIRVDRGTIHLHVLPDRPIRPGDRRQEGGDGIVNFAMGHLDRRAGDLCLCGAAGHCRSGHCHGLRERKTRSPERNGSISVW